MPKTVTGVGGEPTGEGVGQFRHGSQITGLGGVD
jgi:hypothetical protein